MDASSPDATSTSQRARSRPPRVLIAGGGPGGAATAIALAAHGIQALVLERTAGLRYKPGECLSPGFKPLLARLGLSDLLESGTYRPFTGMASAWERAEPTERNLLFEVNGEGWLLDRAAFEARLAEVARARGALWRQGHRVAGVTRTEHGRWRVSVEGERGRFELDADFIVDATGRAAAVARMLGVERQRFDGLVGSWGLLEPIGGAPPPAASPIHIEAMRNGWWYVARLPDGRFSAVLFADRAVLEPEAFLAALEEAPHALTLLGGRAFRLSEPPTAHPAHSSRLKRACGPGWFAVGDAAASFDPLSSYGIGSALGTGFYAAQAIVSAWAGEATSLEAYRYLLDSRYPHYLDTLRERYRAVTRWPDAPFWERRRRQDSDVPLPGEAGPEPAELLRSGRLLVFPTPED
ncbi:tryptophan 7-halogenase [Archangium lansingense]|uniref:Tryptophan 7-halogenase n=1 Tax=Archangium lansingense TaxID=2995310 RepID=A0ABT4AC20_9BACT|nr:tryptophan 7-halogenase [Archangium lansinium]MCY1079214.1 tryptophan 7-halogenase [Archangium lansinium]